ncbi:MAG: apr 2 [Gemmataceae bacterium]|nr:apr 2 [Gemmataceae bacterium]
MRCAVAQFLAVGGLAAPATALLLTSVFTGPVSAGGAAAAHSLPDQAAYVTRLGANRWHAAGYRGRGVKVAVLDTGFRGWHDHLGHALPEHVVTRSFRRDGNLEYRDSQHGILCGEVIHSIAPDTDLLFANWEPGHEDQFLAAVKWAKEQGARVVSVSVIAPSWSDGQGGGAIHRALTDLLGRGDKPADLLCFASAGNTTDRHWAGRFRDGGDGWHAWAVGVTDNGLRPWEEDEVAVELYGRAGGSYELVVLDTATGLEVGRAATAPGAKDRLSAAVRFPPTAGHSYRVRVRHTGGTAGDFHVTTTFASLDRTTPGANVCFPADGSEVVAVGAVDGTGHRQPYSACGTNIRITKPDLAAVVPVATSIRTRPFGGTSAAAPQAAAIAALCLSRHPDWTPARVGASLRATAVDLGTPGPDPETGYGLIRLPTE